MSPLILALLLAAAAVQPIPIRFPLGTLHGFPSMSDAQGRVIADGEMMQQVAGEKVVVHIQWLFADGLRADERDEFRAGTTLSQEQYAWVETRGGVEQRRFEVDFSTGKASASVRDGKGRVKHQEQRLQLPAGRSFGGFGAAIAVSQLALASGGTAEFTFVAFTPAPHAITLLVRREGEEEVVVTGRSVTCDRFRLHPRIPFPINLFAGAKDAQLWLTHAGPPGVIRAEQGLVTKDDPRVVVDAFARGAAHSTAQAPERRGK
jgi:hypothetical protein